MVNHTVCDTIKPIIYITFLIPFNLLLHIFCFPNFTFHKILNFSRLVDFKVYLWPWGTLLINPMGEVSWILLKQGSFCLFWMFHKKKFVTSLVMALKFHTINTNLQGYGLRCFYVSEIGLDICENIMLDRQHCNLFTFHFFNLFSHHFFHSSIRFWHWLHI